MHRMPFTLSDRFSTTGATLALAAGLTWAQPAIELPRASPTASVSQTFGYTTATVTYCRPAVNGRVIWGGLVPYGKVWRAGANEATILELTTDARLNGQPLPKGKYGLFILPTEKEWIDKSIRIKSVYNNLWAKAEMLAADGKIAEAKKYAKQARDAASKNPADAASAEMIDKKVATWK